METPNKTPNPAATIAASRAEALGEKVIALSIAELYPFKNHPFQVRQDAELEQLAQSIRENGVLTPAIVRPRKEDIAVCHAVGQACSVVHTAGHALGYPIYDLTSIVYRTGIEDCTEAVEARSRGYIDKLLYWNAHFSDSQDGWVDFLLK